MAVKAMRIQRLTKDAKENLLEDLLKRSPNNYGQYEQGVQEILAHVKEEKDQAVFAYTKKFDHADITADNKVTEEEIEEAYKEVDPKLVEIIRKALLNIRTYHEKQRQYKLVRQQTGRNNPGTERSHHFTESVYMCRGESGISIFCIDEHCTCKGSRSR